MKLEITEEDHQFIETIVEDDTAPARTAGTMRLPSALVFFCLNLPASRSPPGSEG